VEPGDSLKKRIEYRDFQTYKIQKSRPERSRNPENHHALDRTDEEAQIRTTPVTASYATTYGPCEKEWTMRKETRRDQTFSETTDSSLCTLMENKCAEDIPHSKKCTKTQRLNMKRQVYSFALDILLSSGCTHVDKGCPHCENKKTHTHTHTHTILSIDC